MNWTIIPEQPALSVFVLVLAGLVLMYLARSALHRVVRRLGRLIGGVLRVQSRALLILATRVRERNREILLEIGKAQQERRLDRDFHRVRVIVERDLAQFPDLQHSIGQHINQLEEDYHRTAETPPPAPDWLNAIESVVRLRETQSGNPVVSNVLKDLESNLNRQHRRSLADYRRGMAQRHRLLHGMMPQWRKLNHALERVSAGMRSLLVQADEIDKHLTRYRDIQTGSDRAERLLRVSSLAGFVLSSIALAACLAIAWLNYQLILIPLEQSMAASDIVGGIRLSELAAVTFVAVEMLLGLLLLEVLQVTRLFEGFTALDERMRRSLFWTLLGLLAVFGLAHAGLLYWHEQSLYPSSPWQQLIAYPVIIIEAPMLDQWLPIVARMALGLILPFALVFTAVPLERWVETGRVLLAEAFRQLLQLVSLVLRLLSVIVHNLAELVVALYDLVISVPLWLEARWLERRSRPPINASPAAPASDQRVRPVESQVTVNSR